MNDGMLVAGLSCGGSGWARAGPSQLQAAYVIARAARHEQGLLICGLWTDLWTVDLRAVDHGRSRGHQAECEHEGV